MIALSREEDAFIKSKVSAKVLLCTDERPIAYQEGSSIGGIVPDYLEILKEKSGLSFDFVAYKNHEEMLKAFQEGKGELCAQFPDDFQFSEDQKAMLSQPYMSLTYGFGSSPKKIDSLTKVAYEKGDTYLAEKIRSLGYTPIPFDTTESVLLAVSNGTCDAATMNSMVYEQLSYHAQYRDFSFYVRPELTLSFCLGISANANPLLLTALDKAAGAVTKTALETIRVKNATVVPNWTLEDYIRTNGVTLLLLLILLIFLAVLVFLILRQKRFTRKLELARKEADEANEAKSSFLSSMSHDLRTPLNGIVGFTDLALRERNPERKQAYLNNIKSSSSLLCDLVNDTLELSRIESGKMEVQLSAISCDTLMGNVLSSITPLSRGQTHHP